MTNVHKKEQGRGEKGKPGRTTEKKACNPVLPLEGRTPVGWKNHPVLTKKKKRNPGEEKKNRVERGEGYPPLRRTRKGGGEREQIPCCHKRGW